MTVVTLVENNWLPAIHLKSLVDSLRFSRHFVEEFLIPFDGRAARRPELHERELFHVDGVLLEEAFNTAKTLDQTLRVIHAVNTHSQEQHLRAQLIQNCRPALRV